MVAGSFILLSLKSGTLEQLDLKNKQLSIILIKDITNFLCEHQSHLALTIHQILDFQYDNKLSTKHLQYNTISDITSVQDKMLELQPGSTVMIEKTCTLY